MTMDYLPPLFPRLLKSMDGFAVLGVPAARRAMLEPLVLYGRECMKMDSPLRLHFICSHNSRRSQLAQAWAAALGHHFGLRVLAFSGGTEVTAFHPAAAMALERSGFGIAPIAGENGGFLVSFAEGIPAMHLFSKLFSDASNPTTDFAAVMTCTEADAACPFVPGAVLRVALPFVDPKHADGSAGEAAAYDAASMLIATELFFVFQSITSPTL